MKLSIWNRPATGGQVLLLCVAFGVFVWLVPVWVWPVLSVLWSIWALPWRQPPSRPPSDPTSRGAP